MYNSGQTGHTTIVNFHTSAGQAVSRRASSGVASFNRLDRLVRSGKLEGQPKDENGGLYYPCSRQCESRK